MYDALANSRAALATIIDHLKVPRSGTHHPLFQVALNYRQDNSTRSRFGDVPIEWLDGTNLGYPYDMNFHVNDTPDGTRFCLVTQRYLYGASDARRTVRWYQATLTAFLSDPDISIGSCSMSSPEDYANAISRAQGPRSIADAHRTLAHQIQEMSNLYPDSLAIKDSLGDQSKSLRPQNGDKVAVLLSAVTDLVCSMLAIMRFGLVYVPVDTRNSMERLEAVVSDCQPSTILCDGATEAQIGLLATSGISITSTEHVGNSQLAEARLPEILAAPDEVGFVIYTSRTTGPPEGALLTHSGLTNQIPGITSQFGIGREIVLQSAPPEADSSLEQMFISLAKGGTLVTVPQSAREDATQLANIMLVESITYTAFAESEYLDLLKHGSKTLRKCASWRLAFTRRLESDREVIIQDNRVNLDEIAEVIIREASPAIVDAAVSWREESGMLAVFVTLADESVDNIDVFLRRLKATLPLPTHMIPDVILPVKILPRTLNGRKDFNAIDKLVLSEGFPDRVTTESLSPIEMRVKSIWESLICADSAADLKPESDFFCAGGNSLLLIPLKAALRSELGCSLSLSDMFQFSTIRSMEGQDRPRA